MAEQVRTAMESLAVRYINGGVDDGWVQMHLRDRRPDMHWWDAWALWEALCDAHRAWDDLGTDEARAAFDEQLDLLVHGFVARTVAR
jgi:hypothetical protein